MSITKRKKQTISLEMALNTKEILRSMLPTFSINSESIEASIVELITYGFIILNFSRSLTMEKEPPM